MGRRKQSRPHRSGGIISGGNDSAEQAELENQRSLNPEEAQKNEFDEIEQPYFVEVDRSGWISDHHLDVSEVVLMDLKLGEGFSGRELNPNLYEDDKYLFRFRLCNVSEYIDRIKLGHWPVLPSSDVIMEFVEKPSAEEGMESCTVIFSGSFDGPDEGISSLVHLASLKFMTLRPVTEVGLSKDVLSTSLRIRVEMLRGAFDACESLLENTRQLWKKSMMNAMVWLRPEVMTSEARYGVSASVETDADLHTEVADGNCSGRRKSGRLDVAGFYEAIKPSKTDAMLEEDLPDLLPELRPYQRRAAYWMVQREKEGVESMPRSGESRFSPLCLSVEFLGTDSKMFYNPFSGNVSLHPEHPSANIFGGILAGNPTALLSLAVLLVAMVLWLL
ncbi:hypothetical protein TIFTF001_010350 [Ficus carica]|uniref:Uncharacterized protein n=1 Tax=Ficus carica TaxID=3494 RepID=A0AA87ZPY5_FICCA|nr:hypothetical protein TIFTF001_010350 [Ficus carica]